MYLVLCRFSVVDIPIKYSRKKCIEEEEWRKNKNLIISTLLFPASSSLGQFSFLFGLAHLSYSVKWRWCFSWLKCVNFFLEPEFFPFFLLHFRMSQVTLEKCLVSKRGTTEIYASICYLLLRGTNTKLRVPTKSKKKVKWFRWIDVLNDYQVGELCAEKMSLCCVCLQPY